MKIDYLRLKKYVESSQGYSLKEDGGAVTLDFNTQLADAKEHFESATIRLHGKREGDKVNIYLAQMDYGAGEVKEISLGFLSGWLLSVDEEAETD
ncbi:MAG: hypothetical protein M1357_01515 [Candidatus Marsarchaeota archaeon]|nr:hypothetical protein [Candidatus Marsarchaeota archaeon]